MRLHGITAAVIIGLSACTAPATDCVKVARWIELGIQTRELKSDGTEDATYAAAIEERNQIKAKMSPHEHRFAETFQKQLNEPGRDAYAPIYALCRKWETGGY